MVVKIWGHDLGPKEWWSKIGSKIDLLAGSKKLLLKGIIVTGILYLLSCRGFNTHHLPSLACIHDIILNLGVMIEVFSE